MALEAPKAETTSPASSTLSPARRKKRSLGFENRVLLLALASGAGGVVASILLLWLGNYDSGLRWTFALVLIVLWLSFAFGVRGAVVHPLQTLSNMQSALREGDFSFRVRGARRGDALGELMYEVNTLSELLREQRLGAIEASALLSSVMSEIDVAVFAFDSEQRLRLVNRAGERLLAQSRERLVGKLADELGLEDCLQGESARTLEKTFPGQSGRWSVRRSTFRQGGIPHSLVVLTDLSRALREEERAAWQRLVRVLGHELNNSLAPICSIAGSLEQMVKREPRASDWEDDLQRGLRVIAERSDALSRFMHDYSRLAKLPKPQPRSVDLGVLVRAAAGLETRLKVVVEDGPAASVNVDPDQVQQLLINLIRNAVDASLETQGAVHVGWSTARGRLNIYVRDEGPGIANPSNLFVPFFTTKPGGSGIGLALSRQIAEAHGGSLNLVNRPSGRGCEATIQLPIVN